MHEPRRLRVRRLVPRTQWFASTRQRRMERGWGGFLLLGAALAAAAVFAVALVRPWGAPEPVSAAADAAPAAAAPAPLALPDQALVLVFGDSWVFGSAAITPSLGFAYRLADELGVRTIVDGVRGSGYLKPGIDGPPYGERIARLDAALDPDLVIVEGSINDRRLYPHGYRDAVTQAWDALETRFPEAGIVILGPAPQVLPIEEATLAIDAELSALAAARGWWYVSPIAEEWITTANYGEVIDASAIGRDHPSTEGHAYLARRLAEAIGRMSEPADVVADAPRSEDDVAP